jgi:hypothetical protein
VTLLNRPFIQENILQSDKWAVYHGYMPETGFLGASLLYFSLVYMLPAEVAVILGSGSGFVPRLVRQAQRELPLEKSRTLLIDAGSEKHQGGLSDYHDAPHHPFRTHYPEVEIWKMTTDAALLRLSEEKVTIDFLHIDADHSFEQSLKDFENYLPFMSEQFIITLHDTADGYIESYLDGCVPRTIAYLRKEMQPTGKYAHLELINFNQRFRNPQHRFQKQLWCAGTAIVVPKGTTCWD